MTKYLIIAIVVMLGCIGVQAYTGHAMAKKNGELTERLTTKTDEYDKLKKDFNQQGVDLEERQKRLDMAVALDQSNRQKAQADSKLFRTEIDTLKRSNSEYKKLLETRIPDALLIGLCNKGYASARVCASVLPDSGQLPSGLSSGSTR
jgi:hypothetical protein